MGRRRLLQIFLAFIALVLLGTVIVLSSVSYYLFIDPSAYLSELEVPYENDYARINASAAERIPRIIHQTWKTEVLPQKWQPVSESCRDLMPDYEYMLWTDESARDFIAENYPWFLDTFDHYPYNIQRADAIRYFVLHHFGGIYIDLDIGCRRPLDPLLVYPVILPKTIPVGVSNDLMFSEKEHPFMTQTIHNLATFDHNWVLNYPTVMFSTGPMFLSSQYAIYTSSRPVAVRILPKSLYGKNAKEGEAPHSFFAHYYGSSWHADDAGFIWFLGTKGKWLMLAGLIIVLLGVIRLVFYRHKQRHWRYDISLPGRGSLWHIHLRGRTSESFSPPLSPGSSTAPSSPFDTNAPPLLPNGNTSTVQRILGILRGRLGSDRTSRSRRSSRGVLFFLPAFLTSRSSEMELEPLGSVHSSHPTSNYPSEKRSVHDYSRAGLSHLLDLDEPSASNSRHGRSRSVSRTRSPEP